MVNKCKHTKWSDFYRKSANEVSKRTLPGWQLISINFYLCVNPLSFLLNKLQGYQIGNNGNRNQNISHLFFVDDLKLFATNMSQRKLLLGWVTQFSNDIGMKFGESKCSYTVVDRRKVIVFTKPIVINNVIIKPMKKGDSCKYLGQDENLRYVITANKESNKWILQTC